MYVSQYTNFFMTVSTYITHQNTLPTQRSDGLTVTVSPISQHPRSRITKSEFRGAALVGIKRLGSVRLAHKFSGPTVNTSGAKRQLCM